jgi:hypothetical protein
MGTMMLLCRDHMAAGRCCSSASSARIMAQSTSSKILRRFAAPLHGASTSTRSWTTTYGSAAGQWHGSEGLQVPVLPAADPDKRASIRTLFLLRFRELATLLVGSGCTTHRSA